MLIVNPLKIPTKKWVNYMGGDKRLVLFLLLAHYKSNKIMSNCFVGREYIGS